jgi:Flp pilus assembly protein TadB
MGQSALVDVILWMVALYLGFGLTACAMFGTIFIVSICRMFWRNKNEKF